MDKRSTCLRTCNLDHQHLSETNILHNFRSTFSMLIQDEKKFVNKLYIARFLVKIQVENIITDI